MRDCQDKCGPFNADECSIGLVLVVMGCLWDTTDARQLMERGQVPHIPLKFDSTILRKGLSIPNEQTHCSTAIFRHPHSHPSKKEKKKALHSLTLLFFFTGSSIAHSVGPQQFPHQIWSLEAEICHGGQECGHEGAFVLMPIGKQKVSVRVVCSKKARIFCRSTFHGQTQEWFVRYGCGRRQ